jgi:hypothetical protein
VGRGRGVGRVCFHRVGDVIQRSVQATVDAVDSESAQFFPPKPREEMWPLVWGENDQARRQQTQLRENERNRRERRREVSGSVQDIL